MIRTNTAGRRADVRHGWGFLTTLPLSPWVQHLDLSEVLNNIRAAG